MLDVEALSEMMAGVIADEVEKAVAPLREEIAELKSRKPEQGPPGEKGEKGDQGEPGADGENGRNGADGKDAAGVVDVLKDSGELVFTLADGRLVRTGIRDGEKGEDGRDGFNLEDFNIEKGDDGRTFVLKFERSDARHEYELTFPFPVYRDVYREGEKYVPGDLVTWAGSVWHCDKETSAKPGTDDWTLAVKKGRDGKDAKNV